MCFVTFVDTVSVLVTAHDAKLRLPTTSVNYHF